MNPIPKLLLFSLLVLSSTANAFVIDGKLNDWLGTPVGNKNDWKPTDSTVSYFVEDQSSYFLNPGYGGQAYDAEAIYVKSDALNLYIAVVTGLSPGTTDYPAGDLAFDFGNNGSYEYGVIVKGDSNKPLGGIGNQGQVYKVSQWNVGLWDVNGGLSSTTHLPGDPAHPTTVKAGSVLGLASLVYNSTPINLLGDQGGQHYVIEAQISKAFFDPADLVKPFTLQWTMACANDSISVDPPSNVPTPTILPMLALGLALLIGFKRNPNQIASLNDFFCHFPSVKTSVLSHYCFGGYIKSYQT